MLIRRWGPNRNRLEVKSGATLLREERWRRRVRGAVEGVVNCSLGKEDEKPEGRKKQRAMVKSVCRERRPVARAYLSK